MAMPSAADVGALLTQFQTATTARDQAQVATDHAREALGRGLWLRRHHRPAHAAADARDHAVSGKGKIMNEECRMKEPASVFISSFNILPSAFGKSPSGWQRCRK
jgi:hypothetical protein